MIYRLILDGGKPIRVNDGLPIDDHSPVPSKGDLICVGEQEYLVTLVRHIESEYPGFRIEVRANRDESSEGIFPESS